MKYSKLLLISVISFVSVNICSQTIDTSYQNLLNRLKRTVPYNFNIGAGFGYKFYMQSKEFERLWAELVPEKPDAGYSSFSNMGFEVEAIMPVTYNISAGIFFQQAIKTITGTFNKTSNGENINYFGKEYYLPPGEYQNLKAELGLGSINLGLSVNYFPFKKGSLGIKYLTPFLELAYGISFLRGKFTIDPFGQVERFSKANPLYISFAIGTLFSSYTYWAGFSVKLKAVYSETKEILTTTNIPVRYNDGTVFKARLSNFGISLIGNFIFP